MDYTVAERDNFINPFDNIKYFKILDIVVLKLRVT